jgi:RNA polymerase sigma-70 factor (ECF subfamily)
VEPRAEPELIARARRGDHAAFTLLVAAHQDVAFRTAYLVTGGGAEAEDAAQEAFVKAFRALGRFRDGAPFRPWLLAIVGNEARNRRRSEGRRAGLVLRAGAEAEAAVSGSAEDEALSRLGREELLRAVERLRSSDRDVVACRYLLGLDEAETAEALGCARGTVKSRLSRALERLRAELDPTPGGFHARS